ncbi:NAD-P-binding [Fusarium albosuccineum]|uniref:NAD-P-binding n=1 Tax=Fusarium albosuccineum TaxID=1237068 RepID=A0A8H4KU36_9HYPO|nr:NAD-P-binding [Fusarium albosuccineum]
MSFHWGVLRNRFSAPSLQSLTRNSILGKTVLVTGASSGLGLEAARHYVRLGASRVILAVRSQSKGDEAKRNIRSGFSSERLKSCSIDVWLVDFASFASVRAISNRVIQELESLDIAVLNAAVSKSEYHATVDGWEETLQVNVLSTALFALSILPKMRQSSRPDWKPRLSIVAARAHMAVSEGAAWQDAPNILQELNQESEFGKLSDRYSVSKLLVIYAARQIAKLATTPSGECDIVVNYICPGACKSDLARDWRSLPQRILLYLIQSVICKTTEEGSRTLVYASGLGEESHGQWIHNNRIEKPGQIISSAPGRQLQQKIWSETLEVLAPYCSGQQCVAFLALLADRNLPCSYAPPARKPAPDAVHAERVTQGPSHASPPARTTPAAYRLSRETLGLDFGRGRPEQILREGEFTHSLILLYFTNFSDIHFMFDEELFLRDFALGQVPKLILYSMMALSIRFSFAPFQEELPPSHRGELLFNHARKLLLEEFDWPSVTAIQAYVLLSTYKMAYGGSRQAYVYLGFATNMVRALRLLDPGPAGSRLTLETCRRLVCTMALMDRLMAYPLRLGPHFSSSDTIPNMLEDKEFWDLKRGKGLSAHRSPNVPGSANLAHEILKLSSMLESTCKIYSKGESEVSLNEIQDQFNDYSSSRDASLCFIPANVERHRQHDTLRRFAFMNILYHHVGQLIYFHYLNVPRQSQHSSPEETRDSLAPDPVGQCHYHASKIADIAEYTWENASFDLHNLSIGKILTISTVVNTHALLTAQSTQAAERLRVQLAAVHSCIERVKTHTRMFTWVLQHRESFKKMHNQNPPWIRIFDHSPQLLSEMMYLGSYFEKFPLQYQTSAHREGIESLLRPNDTEVITPEADAFQTDRRQELMNDTTNNLDDLASIFLDPSFLDFYQNS